MFLASPLLSIAPSRYARPPTVFLYILLINLARRSQLDVTGILDRQDETVSLEAMTALEGLRQQMAGAAQIPEVAWARVRSLEFQEALRGRDNLAKRLSKLGCALCEDFSEHVSDPAQPLYFGFGTDAPVA